MLYTTLDLNTITFNSAFIDNRPIAGFAAQRLD